MKRKLQFKRILSLVAMTLLFAWGGGINTTLNAQGSDGFFRGGNDDSYSNRDGMSLGDAVNENPTPLGSGLLIMMAAGAGYAVARRNRKSNSKKTKTSTTLFLALALILGMTQCKKSTVAPTNNDNGVHITLNAGQGAKGDRTDFTPTSFVWTEGATEYIYVGGSAHSTCLGVLSGTGNGETTMSFTGDLTTTPNDGETLHFFYLGKGRDGSAVTTLDFSNQDGTLDNVTKYHIAIGDATYSTGQTSFSASLEMKMAIAYFNTSNFGSEEVFLHGNNIISKVNISYISGELNTTSLTAVYGYINTGSGKNGAYVALIPSTEAETTLKLESNSKQGGEITFSRGIQAGRYYSNSGAALSVSEPTSVTNDVIKGLFTVSPNKGVRFAKGNLQYTRESTDVAWSTGSYSFLANQYDVVETGNVSENYGSQTAVGLFGWGTGNNPTTTSTTIDDYSTFTDWGSSVSIGDYTWHTLSSTEWNYLLNTRSASTINETPNARFVRANVHGKNGVVLFPDSFSYPTDAGFPVPVASNINKAGWSNVYLSYSDDNWVIMEQKGAVFLPFTGYREGTTLKNNTTAGYYSSSENNSGDNCKHLLFNNSGISATSSTDAKRSYGRAVRLVRDVE
ncbi:MAG: hypothetical protein J6W12_01030 [Bacteroidales bacterium]|nr:hypothetical protein [Bacteroidales bacterium]